MAGLTDREKALAIAAQGPGTGICLALADLELFWENHRENAPDVHELRMNLRITDEGTPEERLAAVQAVADWLGVPVTERYGCHIAQRRFGTGDDAVIIEAHVTPDQDHTHALLSERRDAAQARPELAVA
jgi:hypothetical protein